MSFEMQLSLCEMKLFHIIQNKLDKLDIDGKTLRWIRNLYWEQTAAVRVENQLSDWIEIERGVRQGCVLSPDLFSLYSEIILRAVEELPGVGYKWAQCEQHQICR